MEFFQLRAFVAVAQLGHLTRAAGRLHLSQPAVSHQIKALEEEVGLRLFERAPSGITLSAAGRELLPLAEQVLAGVDGLLFKAHGLRGEVLGKVRLGTIVDPIFLRLGESLSKMLEGHPRLTIETRHGSSGLVLEGVRAGELDAGYVISPTPLEAGVVGLALSPMRYVIVAPAAWQAKIENAEWNALARLPWIGSPPFSSQTWLRREIFAAKNLALPSFVQETDQEASRRSLVAAGIGLGLMREDLAREAAAAGELVIWPGHVAHTTLWLVYLPTREDDPTLMALRSVLRTIWAG